MYYILTVYNVYVCVASNEFDAFVSALYFIVNPHRHNMFDRIHLMHRLGLILEVVLPQPFGLPELVVPQDVYLTLTSLEVFPYGVP